LVLVVCAKTTGPNEGASNNPMMKMDDERRRGLINKLNSSPLFNLNRLRIKFYL
jgi:hypothetical protein